MSARRQRNFWLAGLMGALFMRGMLSAARVEERQATPAPAR